MHFMIYKITENVEDNISFDAQYKPSPTSINLVAFI